MVNKFKVNQQNWKTLPNVPTIENNYNHLIGNLSGLMMVCLISPNQKKLINKLKEKNIDFKHYLEENESQEHRIT